MVSWKFEITCNKWIPPYFPQGSWILGFPFFFIAGNWRLISVLAPRDFLGLNHLANLGICGLEGIQPKDKVSKLGLFLVFLCNQRCGKTFKATRVWETKKKVSDFFLQSILISMVTCKADVLPLEKWSPPRSLPVVYDSAEKSCSSSLLTHSLSACWPWPPWRASALGRPKAKTAT